MVEPFTGIALLLETRIDTSNVIDAREMIRVASDALKIVILCDLNSTLFLHGVPFIEPEFSILEGLLLDLTFFIGNQLNDCKLALLLLFWSK